MRCRRVAGVATLSEKKCRGRALVPAVSCPSRSEVAIGRKRNRLDEGHEIRQLRGIETFGVKQELGDARPALSFQIGIVAVPFVWRGFRDAAQGAVRYAVAAQLRRFQIPCHAINVVIGMASGAGKLALKTEFRVVEEAAHPGEAP